jgi:hypothetical protein
VVVGVLSQLALDGQVPPDTVAAAIARYGIDPGAAPPWHG